MKKKILSAAMALLLMFGSAAALPESYLFSDTSITASAALEYGDLYYEEQSDGTIAISGLKNRVAEINIPRQIDGKKVTVIKNSAFAALQPNKVTTKVILPDTLTTIEQYAFMNMQALTSITIPSSVKTIGLGVFNNCKALQTVTFNGSLTSFGTCVFSGCTSLKKVDLPSGVTALGGSTFLNCTSLTSVSIPASVTSISNSDFNGCTALQSITVASGNSNYSSSDGVLYNKAKTKIICCPMAKTSITIPGTVKEIGEEQFYQSKLTSVVLQSGVTTIGPKAFAFCESLSSVTLPDTLTKIGDWAFNTCTSLKEITVPASVTSIGKCALGFYRTTVDGDDTKQNGFTMKVYENSTAHKWASDNKVNFVIIGQACSHTYNTPTWSWASDYSTAKATAECSKCHKKLTVDASVSKSTTAATCTTAGKTVFTASASFGGKTYTDKKEKSIPIDSNAHKWNSPTYSWSSDNKTCTATRACANNSKHNVTEVGTVTSKQKTAATCTTKGVTTYTATFKNSVFKTQTKDVSDIPATGHKWTATYTWTKTASGYSCKGSAVCQNNSSHTASQTVTATLTSSKAATCTAKGSTTYTATFSNSAFTKQTKTVEVAATGHSYGDPSWTWASNYSTATAKFTCSKGDDTHSANAVVTSVTTNATCTTEGKTVYTAKVTFNGKTYTDTKTVIIAAKGHKWNTPAYKWEKTSTGYNCTAARVCQNNSKHKETETVIASYKVTKTPTTTAEGEGTYTAVFSNSGFETKTKTVTLPKKTIDWDKPTYKWTTSGKDYICTATRYAKNVSGKKEDETVTAKYQLIKAPTCTKAGEAEYIATFKNAAFESQSKTVYPAASGHSYGAWKTTAFNVSKGTSTQTQICSVCGAKNTKTVNNSVKRLSGKNRYATASAISNGIYSSSASTVILASGLNPADALAAAPLASAYNAPILLTKDKSLPDATLQKIKRLGAKNIIIIGGDSAVGPEVVNTLKKNGFTDKTITRVKGSNKYGTSVAIADALYTKTKKYPTELFFVMVTKDNYADALSVSSIAAIKKAPIIYLPTSGNISDTITNYLKSVKSNVTNAYVIGGTSVITDSVMKSAGSTLGLTFNKTIVRVYGSNRYGTCVEVNKKFAGVLTGKSLCIATGCDFPDALAGGVFAAKNTSPLFLVNGKVKNLSLSDIQKNLLKTRTVQKIYILGGTSSVPDAHAQTVANASV